MAAARMPSNARMILAQAIATPSDSLAPSRSCHLPGGAVLPAPRPRLVPFALSSLAPLFPRLQKARRLDFLGSRSGLRSDRARIVVRLRLGYRLGLHRP